ncbi:TDT family transporter [Chitinibacter bivalviorum]|uniref:TDT family transporter n=1 Tax=Chitinibacter bivalviorum TaxID=2739434 RepID=A0A7H9BL71_9NEIS|nr:TDT family transporter [Chitinibacter bivalviorum]QLG89142.1 TDT family transporter [Chitinibacter bivalviorum]
MSPLSINNVSQRFRDLPTPMAGLALGIGGLGMCIDAAFKFGGRFELLTMTIVGVLLLSLCIRFAMHYETLKADLKHPVIGSVAPTFAMALMVFSHGVHYFLPAFGTAIWMTAILLHVFFLVKFIRYRRRDFSLHHMVPSWFVPPVGIAVAAVAWAGQPSDWTFLPAWLCMAFALACYVVMMPLMFYRLMFRQTIPEGAQPTIAILAAPASLTLAAYLNVAINPSPLIVIVMLGLAMTMTLIVYGAFIHLLRLPFSPGYAAFTFPMAIGATALYKVEAIFVQWKLPADLIHQVDVLGRIELGIATAVICYVAVRYTLYFVARFRQAE